MPVKTPAAVPAVPADMPAIIRQYPAPRPGLNGPMISLEALAAYCKYYGYRVVSLRGDVVVIEPIKNREAQNEGANE